MVPSSYGRANHSAEMLTNRVGNRLEPGYIGLPNGCVSAPFERKSAYSGVSWMCQYQGMTARSMSVTRT
jgi:hypothetical protein